MAKAGAVRAGRAFIELFADDSKLVRGLSRAKAKVTAFGEGVKNMGVKIAAVGAAAVTGLGAATKIFSDTGDALAKMSQRTGISVESLSELDYAAEQSGTDLTTLETGVRKMQRSITDAGQGSKTATEALGHLGLTFEQLKDLTPEEQFELIADRLSKLQDPTAKAAAAMELLGRSGTELIPLMAKGAAGIETLKAEARGLGLTVSSQDAAAAEKLNDQMGALVKVLRRGAFAIGAALAPALGDLIDRVTTIAVRVVNWIKANQNLIVSAAKIAVVVLAVGVGLIALGVAIKFVGSVMGALAVIFGIAHAAIAAVIAVISAMLTPIGLVITALGVLGVVIFKVTGAAGATLAWLADRFRGLKDDALKAFQGISDALMAGDIGLAARILWLVLRLEWLKGINFLKQKWIDFKEFFVTFAQNTFAGALAAWEIVQNGLVVAWIETTAWLSKIWEKFTAGFNKAWNTAITWTEKRLLDLMGLFDKKLDVGAAKKLADEELAKTNTQIDQERDKTLAQNEEKRAAARAIADKEHEAALNKIASENKKDNDQASAQFEKERGDSEAAVSKARKDFEDAVAEAAHKRKEAEGMARPTPGQPGPAQFDDAIESVKKKVEVRGTFNAAAVLSLLGSGSAQERTAKATEETAKNTKKLLDQDDRLTFA